MDRITCASFLDSSVFDGSKLPDPLAQKQYCPSLSCLLMENRDVGEMRASTLANVC